MTDDAVLEQNLRRLIRDCAPRLTNDDVDRALARFEGRRRSAPAPGRILAAAAAALLLAALLAWLVHGAKGAPTAPTPAQVSPDEIARLIGELAAPETREKARARLIAIGPSALPALERALYHEDPEVRVQSQTVAKALRRVAEIRAPVAFVRAAVRIARARWAARNFDDFDQAVREAFDPQDPEYVHYVPRKEVGDHFDMMRGHSTALRGAVMPGRADLLPKPVVDALEAKDGVVFLEPPGIPTDLGPVVVFTLPDKVGWSAYVVVVLPGIENLAEALRLNTVFSVDDLELFLRRARFGPPQGGGIPVLDLDASSPCANILKKGDLVVALDGKPVADPKDLAPLTDHVGHIVTLDRQGKVFSWEVRALQRVVLKLKPEGEIAARNVLEEADQAWTSNPDRALALYLEFLTRYAGSELLTKERREQILDRIATLQAKKAAGK